MMTYTLCPACSDIPGTDDEPGYHGLSRGGTTLQLYPGELFSIYGPGPVTDPKITAEPKAGRKLSEWILPAIRAEAVAPKAVVPAKGGAAPKYGAGLNVVQTSDWLNVTVKSYDVPSDYTTYSCNVSSGSQCFAGTRLAVGAHCYARGAFVSATKVVGEQTMSRVQTGGGLPLLKLRL